MFKVVKDKNQWVVLDTISRVFYYPEKGRGGKTWAYNKANELNRSLLCLM